MKKRCVISKSVSHFWLIITLPLFHCSSIPLVANSAHNHANDFVLYAHYYLPVSLSLIFRNAIYVYCFIMTIKCNGYSFINIDVMTKLVLLGEQFFFPMLSDNTSSKEKGYIAYHWRPAYRRHPLIIGGLTFFFCGGGGEKKKKKRSVNPFNESIFQQYSN